MPSPPAYLNVYAREEWDRIAGTLYAIGTLREIDQNNLGAYCMAYSRWRQAEEDLERMAQLDGSTHGAVLKTKHGNFIQNPLVGVANTLRRDMQRLASEFGLSPSSRTQIEAGLTPEQDAISRKYFG
jgi:P27 family predicted phage terminase small subunit